MSAPDENPRTLSIDLTPGAWALGDQLVEMAQWPQDRCRAWLADATPYDDGFWRVFRPASLRRACVALYASSFPQRPIGSQVKETWR